MSRLLKTLSGPRPRELSSSPRRLVRRVMVFGTFDLLHPGHDHFFKQARNLVRNISRSGKAFLIASVARDKNVQRIKGRRPINNEQKRLALLRKHPLVDRVILGAVGNHIPHIVRQRPHIIALGYDQRDYIKGLRVALKQHGLVPKIVRLKPYKPQLYKSSLLLRKI
jgi:FAD synthetase